MIDRWERAGTTPTQTGEAVVWTLAYACAACGRPWTIATIVRADTPAGALAAGLAILEAKHAGLCATCHDAELA